jgi:ubiquinone/menaquinone biosynthesis C-methylase UbiE
VDNDTAKALYERINTDAYDADEFGLLTSARRIALEQIESRQDGRSLTRMVDLAVGTAEFLRELKLKFPSAALYGIDISENMLAAALKKVRFEKILDSAENVAHHVPAGSIDLAVLHFVLAYVSPEKVFAQMRRILSPNGMLSVATSTRQSFPRLTGFAMQYLGAAAVDAATMLPVDANALQATARGAGLRTLESRSFDGSVTFPDFDSLLRFGVGAGWFAQYFRMFSSEQLERVRKETAPFFPITDEAKLEVFLFGL